MKFDTVAPYESAYPEKVASKGIGREDGQITVITVKADVKPERELNRDTASLLENRSYGEREPTHFGNILGQNHYVVLEDSIKADQGKGIEDSNILPIGKIELATQERENHAPNTKFELPETVSCGDEGDCHAVKDICIDEGVQCVEKVQVDNNQKLCSRFDHSLPNVDYTLTKAIVDSAKVIIDDSDPNSHELESSLENDIPVSLSDKTGSGQCSFESSLVCEDNSVPVTRAEAIQEKQLLPQETEEKLVTEQCSLESSLMCGDKSVSVTPNDAVQEKQLLPKEMQDKLVAEQCAFESSLICEEKSLSGTLTELIQGEQLSPQELAKDSGEVNSSKLKCPEQKHYTLQQRIDKGTPEEENSSTEVAAAEETVQSNEAKGSPEGEVGLIKLHLDSGVATTSGREESEEKTYQQSGLSRYVSNSEDAALDGASASARSSFVHHGHAGLNLYGPASLSGRFTSSGHIAYSGNISLRSDSSTTSARSFAFPTLQNEWNSSPVKMAKPDRRQLRKHRGSRMGILCCRF